MKSKVFLVVIIAVLVMILGCSDSKSTEPKVEHATVVFTVNISLMVIRTDTTRTVRIGFVPFGLFSYLTI